MRDEIELPEVDKVIVLTEDESAKLRAMVGEAQQKVDAIRSLFDGDTRSYFILALTLAALNENCSLGTHGMNTVIDRVKEWIIIGMPDQFTADEIIAGLIDRTRTLQ